MTHGRERLSPFPFDARVTDQKRQRDNEGSTQVPAGHRFWSPFVGPAPASKGWRTVILSEIAVVKGHQPLAGP